MFYCWLVFDGMFGVGDVVCEVVCEVVFKVLFVGLNVVVVFYCEFDELFFEVVLFDFVVLFYVLELVCDFY